MMEKRQPLQQMYLGKVVIWLQKTETGSMPMALYKYQLKLGLRTLILDPNLVVTTEKSKKYPGSKRYRQGLPQ
jgi:hypothetical protein